MSASKVPSRALDNYDVSTRIFPGQKAFSLFTRRSNPRPIHGFRLSGIEPEHMHIWLGSGKPDTLRVNNFSPYWHRLRGQLTDALAVGPEADTAPQPCSHCPF